MSWSKGFIYGENIYINNSIKWYTSINSFTEANRIVHCYIYVKKNKKRIVINGNIGLCDHVIITRLKKDLYYVSNSKRNDIHTFVCIYIHIHLLDNNDFSF